MPYAHLPLRSSRERACSGMSGYAMLIAFVALLAVACNLMVVLCGEREAQSVVNAVTL